MIYGYELNMTGINMMPKSLKPRTWLYKLFIIKLDTNIFAHAANIQLQIQRDVDTWKSQIP